MIHIENPRESTKTKQNNNKKELLELITEFNKVLSYKINAQKSIFNCILYKSTEHWKSKIKKQYHLQ